MSLVVQPLSLLCWWPFSSFLLCWRRWFATDASFLLIFLFIFPIDFFPLYLQNLRLTFFFFFSGKRICLVAKKFARSFDLHVFLCCSTKKNEGGVNFRPSFNFPCFSGGNEEENIGEERRQRTWVTPEEIVILHKKRKDKEAHWGCKKRVKRERERESKDRVRRVSRECLTNQDSFVLLRVNLHLTLDE